jgi:hypothetical protein
MDSAIFAILLFAKLAEEEHQDPAWPVLHATEARLLTYFSKALELRTDHVLTPAQRASLTMAVSADTANSDHLHPAHSHPLFQLLTSHSLLF